MPKYRNNRRLCIVAELLIMATTLISCSRNGGESTTAVSAEEDRSPAVSNEKSAVLPEEMAQELTGQCSRSGPGPFEKTWQPQGTDIRKLESRLGSISSMASIGMVPGRQIKNPDRYYRQYVGIVVGKRKLIYINAFCEPWNPPREKVKDWHQQPFVVCDGGSCLWGALYDPASGEFSDLEVNGIA
jgi:hypothetical protein